MKPKNLYFKRLFLGITLTSAIFLAGAPHAKAATDAQAEASSPFRFFADFSIKNLFKKNIEQKKESLEKNKDIRNKLIQEKSEKSFKFNTKKEEIYAHPTSELADELNDNIIRLKNIEERLTVRAGLIENEQSLASTTDKLEQAGLLLEKARKNVELLDLVLTNATTTASTSAEIANDTVSYIKSARESLVETTVYLTNKLDNATSTAE